MKVLLEPAVLAAAALVVIVTGVWLTRAGRPFSTAIVTVHKLVALVGTIAAGLLVRQAAVSATLRSVDVAVIVAAVLLSVAAFASGGAVSAMRSAPPWVTWLHRVVTWLAIAAVALCLITLGVSTVSSQACTPTLPNGEGPPGEPPSEYYLGNGALYTVLWPDGVVVFEPGGPGEIREDGSLAMKWVFVRGDGTSGPLGVEGRSLHRSGLAVAAEIPDGYGLTGVQALGLVFPEAGCYEVTARVGVDSLTFVTRVELRD